MDNIEIYEPQEDSYLLESVVKKLAKGNCLDVGSGSGILAFAAAKKANVKSMIAVDINPNAVTHIKQISKKNKLKKITVKQSDLFSNIKQIKNSSQKFDTISFNPPYLPKDKREGVELALANSGGKHGYELTVRFLNEANKYLTKNGKILLLISSLTKPEKIDEAIKKNLFTKKIIAQESFFMEKLYVLEIQKSDILKKIEDKNITNIEFLGEGKRGLVFSGIYCKNKVAIKIKKDSSDAQGTLAKEAFWLKKLGRQNMTSKANTKLKNIKKFILPKYYFSSTGFVVREFVEGQFIIDYFETHNKNEIKFALKKIFEMLYLLDSLKINKEEMHNPKKHILIDGKNVNFIDFERMNFTHKPKNITQFLMFIGSAQISKTLNEKGFQISQEQMIELGKRYRAKEVGLKKLLQQLN